MLKTNSNYQWLVSFKLFRGHVRGRHVTISFIRTSDGPISAAPSEFCLLNRLTFIWIKFLRLRLLFGSCLENYSVSWPLLSAVTFSCGRTDRPLHRVGPHHSYSDWVRIQIFVQTAATRFISLNISVSGLVQVTWLIIKSSAVKKQAQIRVKLFFYLKFTHEINQWWLFILKVS